MSDDPRPTDPDELQKWKARTFLQHYGMDAGTDRPVNLTWRDDPEEVRHRASILRPRPMWLPPTFARMFTYDAILTGAAVVGGIFVALFLLGWIRP